MTSTDISREDLLLLLASMGIGFSKDTKLPIGELNKRLANALDASQQIDELVDTTPLDQFEFPNWSGKSIAMATYRSSVEENMKGSASQHYEGNVSAKEHTFQKLRQTILGIAASCDTGHRVIYLMDVEGKWGIFLQVRHMNFPVLDIVDIIRLQVLCVYRIKHDVPLFLLVYRELIPTPEISMEALLKLFPFDPPPVTISVSDLERRTLLRLFERNAKRLHSKHQAMHEHANRQGAGVTSSFFLPLCPLGLRIIGKLANNAGCEMCGKKNTSRCAQCLSVVYCGRGTCIFTLLGRKVTLTHFAECQMADWKKHKATCRSLKGGSWNKIKVDSLGDQMPHCFILSRLDPTQNSATAGISTMGNESPAFVDIHNGKIFLAKFQISLAMDDTPLPHMLIYDRARSFQLIWHRGGNPKLFEQGCKMMDRKLKIYRWVRRLGNYEFEICLDRAPETDPLW